MRRHPAIMPARRVRAPASALLGRRAQKRLGRIAATGPAVATKRPRCPTADGSAKVAALHRPSDLAMNSPPRVALFATCLVDLFRPAVGFAAVRLLEAAGCRVEVPRGQTCCGQPAYNSGDRADAITLARQTIRALKGYDYVVVPSGSCGGTLKKHYPTLFDDPAEKAAAEDLAGRTHELVSFLTDVVGLERVDVALEARVTYHDACSGLRELAIRDQPRKLLGTVSGLELAELEGTEVCCGFGGTFCVKYPDISTRMVDDKADAIERTGAELVLAGDLGCLMNIAGRLQRRGSKIAARHVAEVLAGALDAPPIGKPAS
jgi:L-lactate dehydrogenase complex protein LldE